VTHRVAKFRKMAGAFNGGKKGGEAATEEAESDDGAEAIPNPKKAGKGGKGGKKRAAVEEDDEYEHELKRMKAEDSDNYQ